MSRREQEVAIETLPRPDLRGLGLVGVPVVLTRVQGKNRGYEISTVRPPLRDCFETVLFPLEPNSNPIGPIVTESKAQAIQVHRVAVTLVAESLKI